MRKTVSVPVMVCLVLVSGCIGPGMTLNPSVEELAANLEDFVGTNVYFNASPVKYTESVSFTHYIDVDTGNGIVKRLDIRYDEGIDCDFCNISGKVMNSTFCDCQSAKCNGEGCTVSDESSWKYIDTRLVSECDGVSKYFVFGQMWQRSLFRCVPDTGQVKYYVNVTEVSDMRT